MNLIQVSARPCITLSNNRAITNSLDVADFFQKRHDNLLRDIRSIMADVPIEFASLNFEECFKNNELANGKTEPYYNLTRDAFTLLAMGFTGKKALAFKLAYIEAFNQMEAAIKGNTLHPSTITPEMQSTLQSIVADKSSGNGKHRAMMWSRFNRHFKIDRYSQLPVTQFEDALAYMQAIPAFGDPETEEDSIKHLSRAFEVAAKVSAEVTRMAFDSVIGSKEEANPWQSRRWLFGFSFDSNTNRMQPVVRPVDPDACVVTLMELADAIHRGGDFSPTNDELIVLARACQSRLMGRAGITDTH